MNEDHLSEGIIISNEGFPTFCVEDPWLRWMRVGDILHDDCPTLFEVTKSIRLALINAEIDANISLLDMAEDPYLHADWAIARLNRYFYSLHEICKQIVYSTERIILYSSWGTLPDTSTETNFYIFHYIFDFFTRIKSVTDLLALIMNHVFELKLKFEDCSLEKGRISNELRGKYSDAKIQDLARNLDRVGNRWISALYLNVRLNLDIKAKIWYPHLHEQ